MITNQLLTAEASLPGWTVRVVFAATLVWLAATLLVFAARTASAAVRHRVWALSVVGVLALPALIAALPELRTGWLDLRLAGGPLADVPSPVDRDGENSPELVLPRDPAATAPSNDALADVAPPGTSRATAERESSDTAKTLSAATVPFHQPSAADVPLLWNRTLGWFVLWAVPAAVGLVWTARSMRAARRLVREAAIIDDETCRGLVRRLAPSYGRHCAVELRESGATFSPLCVGWRWPTIVLPRGWRAWPEENLAAAVAHELAHVVRRDVGWQLLARMACALYWFHPLAWVAAWRMRVEREAACDDWALASGQAATRYARVLLDLASQLSAPHPTTPTAAVAMAGCRGFERRIQAIVAQHRRRQPVARSVAWLLALATLGVVVVAGTISPLASSRADTEPGSGASKTTKASAAEGAKTEAIQSTLRVKGHVVDEQGRGVSGTHVEAFCHRSRPSTDTARDGEFELEVPSDPRIPLTLRATADDGSRQAFYQLTDVDQLPPAVQLVLRPAREVPMTVVDDQGKPVADAWVAAMVHWFELMDEAVTDAAGKAVLRVPADANMQYVMADKPDVGLDYFVYRRPDETASDPYKLPPDHREALELVLNGARTVTVHVVDHDEQPMAGVPVAPWYFEKPKKGDILNIGGVEHFYVPSDERGHAVFHTVPIDNSTPITIWTGREDHFMPERTVFDPQSDVTELTATLLPLVPVSGRVTFADGRPAAGAEVQIDGRGHQVDSFHESMRTGEDGRFEIRVNPDQFYLFGASLDRWATPLESRVVRLGIPLDDVDLVLQQATRVYGRLTMGNDPKPASGESLYLYMYRDDDEHLRLPQDEQLPNPNNDNKSIQPRITRNTKTDDQGEFEFFAGPGHGYLIGPKGVKPPMFVVVDQDELELNLHADRPDRVELAGRVVLRAAPAQGIGDVGVLGVAHKGGGMFIKAASGDDGSFRVQRTPCEMLLYALSADRLWGAIARLGPDDPRVVISVAPTATATGRLVDATAGRPLTQRQLKFAVKEGLTVINVFGGSTSTDKRGEFVLDGLVPGCEYQLEVATDRDQDGQARGWLTTGYVKPESADTVDLGDVNLTPKDRAPTLAELIDRTFQRSAPLETRLRGGLLEAKSNEQRLLVLVTRRESAAARRFFSHLYHLDDDEVPDRRVRQFLDDYVLLVVDAGLGEQHDDSQRFVEKLGLEWPQADAASIAVSGADGKLLGRTMLRVLPADGQLDRERLTNFLREHAPKPPDAEQLLDEALFEAKKHDKRILIQHSGAFSGPCVLLSRFLDAHRELLAKDYVCVKLDERFARGELIMASLRRQDATSVPWIVIVDADRKRLATSDAEWGNIGYPDSPAAIQHFEKMLRETARNLTDDDIECLVRDLAK